MRRKSKFLTLQSEPLKKPKLQDEPEVPKKPKIIQPCCKEFTTDGTGRIKIKKPLTVTALEQKNVDTITYELAWQKALQICKTNPKCIHPLFVSVDNISAEFEDLKYIIYKETWTIRWQCSKPKDKKKDKKDGKVLKKGHY